MGETLPSHLRPEEISLELGGQMVSRFRCTACRVVSPLAAPTRQAPRLSFASDSVTHAQEPAAAHRLRQPCEAAHATAQNVALNAGEGRGQLLLRLGELGLRPGEVDLERDCWHAAGPAQNFKGFPKTGLHL